jgi:hypothetical protein
MERDCEDSAFRQSPSFSVPPFLLRPPQDRYRLDFSVMDVIVLYCVVIDLSWRERYQADVELCLVSKRLDGVNN